MNWPGVIGFAVAVAALVILKIFILSPDKHPGMMKYFAGCYHINEYKFQEIKIYPSGRLRYMDRFSSVSPSIDKIGWSLLPDKKIVVNANGEIEFQKGYPLLLRFDKSKSRLIIPSEYGNDFEFKKGNCL